MKHNIILFVIVLLSAAWNDVYAQKRRTEKAYETFAAGEYYNAIDDFKNAYSKTGKSNRSARTELVFMIAECYRQVNDPRNAETWYRQAVRSATSSPEAQYRLAEAMKKNGKFQQAIDEFMIYKQIAPSDARADQQIRACELALEWTASPEAYIVEDMKDLNSRLSDFSPAYGRDDYGLVYFTSSRDDAAGGKTHGATGQNFTDIFESRLDRKGKWSSPVPARGLNSEFEDGTPTFLADYREAYFTRCEVGKREQKGCIIMHSTREGDSWSTPANSGILPDSLVAAHPALSPDGVLYFVSDIPGGYGGKDIWSSEKTGNAWSKPVNLGPGINTAGDEQFPFVRNDGALYFSSDGHVGMGGLDIFKAVPQPDGSWTVTNMKPPINSYSDDFGITFEGVSEKGMFSSTRKGRGNDDIYSFEMPPLTFNVTGLVKDEDTGAAIPGSTVQLIASDGSNFQVETGASGDFKFALKANVDYIFLASKQGYLNGKEKETTKGQDKSRDFMVTIMLMAIGEPFELPNILYDFGKWELRPESMVSLDRLVETLFDNPHITIELMSHTDSRDTEEYNQELSQRRAQSVVQYLIDKGIEHDRLSARGYGESIPKEIDSETAASNPFLPAGVILTEEYINTLAGDEQKEIAHQINRRTEFKVLRTDYEPADR
ncbi:MAG: OmpA family protein [Bacteroidales bacterium]|jgi:peptidoglycan-associated lipoprotein|nr:OmpA family protein [Bacteroidales bacterium]